MYTPIKGKTLKKSTQPTGRDFAESVGSVSGLVADLCYLKDDVIQTVDKELERVDTALENMGYDGIAMPDNGRTIYQIFKPEKLTTKSQLEQIWNKAHNK